MGALSIKIYGAITWNDLSKELKDIPKIEKFRLKYKETKVPYAMVPLTTN